GGVVDRRRHSITVAPEAPGDRGEPVLGARHRELVRLREVQHDVGDVPAVATRGTPPVARFATGESRRELGLLAGQRLEHRLDAVAGHHARTVMRRRAEGPGPDGHGATEVRPGRTADHGVATTTVRTYPDTKPPAGAPKGASQ